jgi:hypothetical protein
MLYDYVGNVKFDTFGQMMHDEQIIVNHFVQATHPRENAMLTEIVQQFVFLSQHLGWRFFSLSTLLIEHLQN